MEWIIIVLVLLILFIGFLAMMARVTVRPKVHTHAYEMEKLLSHDFMKGEDISIENEHTVETFDGKKLWVGFVPGDPENKHYVVLSHGYTSTRYGTYKYVALWRKMGYNCVLYENRGHGANEPAVVSFGYREARDLMTVIDDTYKRYGDDIRIGLHGESMGSGLQVMALQYNPKVDFIVNDCGYSEILPVIKWKAEQVFHLPNCIAKCASYICKVLYGFSFLEVRPIDHLKNNEVPICFVHGDADTFTHVWHSQKMYEANKGYKELHLFEGAEHAECIVLDTPRYEKMLRDFVEKVYAAE